MSVREPTALTLMEGVFEQVIGNKRYRLILRNFHSDYLDEWAQGVTLQGCDANAEYLDEAYCYPWAHIGHCTRYAGEGNPNPLPINQEIASQIIQGFLISLEKEKQKKLKDQKK